MASSSVDTGKISDACPLWRHVIKLEKLAEKGGNTRFQCKFCNGIFTGSYSRVRAHLLKIKEKGVRACTKVSAKLFRELQREEEEAVAKNAPPVDVSLPSQTQFVEPSGMKRKKGPLEKSFNMEGRSLVDEEIARLFYSAGLPFNVAKNPHFVKIFKLFNDLNIGGYVPPTYNALRTTLLAKEKAHIERCLQPIKDKWEDKGVTIVSDGWTDTQRRPLINFMGVSDSAPMFLKAVNCEGEYKDKYFISNLMKEVIEQVGVKNVVQVITDNAPVCKAAGRLIEARYPHIFWTPCVVHTLNLALKSICTAKNTEGNAEVFEECRWINDVADKALKIKNFIVNHNMRLAMYNDCNKLKLLSIADTRFASIIIMLRRLKVVKLGLAKMVVSREWNSYREDDALKAQEVRNIILDDLWWDQVDYILDFTSPIYDMIRFADTDKSSLHLIYEMWDNMIEKVKNIIYRHEGKELHEDSSFYNVVHDILVSRWTKGSSPLHCLAHALNPRYYSRSWLNADPNRVAPNRDIEINTEIYKCFSRLYPNDEARDAVKIEFAKFAGALGGFGQHESLQDKDRLDPLMWWHIHGIHAPNIQALAFKLLLQPSSSSCCERNWSTYQFIVSLRRNKLLPQRADDLVFVHNNLRLLSRRTDEYMKGSTKLWDVGGDIFEIADGAEGLEVADLSLDEPEMEAMLFVDGDANDYEGLDDENV